jgi:hypothetical protein
MKLIKIELITWFLLVAGTLAGYATLKKSESRDYMERHSALNGYVASEIDEMDGGN